MCDCLHSALLSHSSVISTCNLGFNALPTPRFVPFLWYSKSKAQYASPRLKPSSNTCIKAKLNSSPLNSDDYGFYGEFGIKEDARTEIQWNRERRDEDEDENLSPRDGIEDGYLEFHGENSGKDGLGRVKDEELVRSRVDSGDVDSKLEKRNVKGGRQMMRRSSMIAKQVITINSALSLGFVSQLWVDINSRVVLLVEVRPNLLSGEVEWCLLEDVKQVGDVLLVKDESVLENQFRLAGLETLVGYNVVTQGGRQNIGKVRDYTFNVNSGVVESLELDSLGIPMIPSSLVSTYGLFVEDVVTVLSDTIVVKEAAASRIQRLTKGLWSGQYRGNSIDELEDYADVEETQHPQPNNGKRRRRNSSRKKFKERNDDWEHPMDFI
nr:uncharacterized protein LOC109179203 isoform X1 [Ipomoea batatas]